eukprot:CAMPEP_0204019742 /NCGR_PEP_ID=MMETSP0360-20130528/28957_1 /ASSEMBLY_ACC=CAM_ASM_000342 /TAXON_ID=268821 /ORGANISM="Scrippsiella Hangoei, Strain SHTV-5" /LENGTH=662 /DNA_ID=CAMNT_0050962993 /DNA_START=37 /DNA_END=2025 /DNA_ORIENTATION=+
MARASSHLGVLSLLVVLRLAGGQAEGRAPAAASASELPAARASEAEEEASPALAQVVLRRRGLKELVAELASEEGKAEALAKEGAARQEAEGEAEGEARGDSEAEAEEAEGENEDEEVNPVTLVVGIMVFAFLFINMVILHCINYPDPNIRSYIYRMMSTTISVFLAVVGNEGMYSLWVDQIIPAPFPRGLSLVVGYKIKLIVGAGQLLFFYLLLNIIAFKLRNSRGKGYIYALKVIGGHITAFAGITFFGCMQETEIFRHHIGMSVLVICIATASMAALRHVSHKVRVWMHRRDMRRKRADTANDEEQSAKVPLTGAAPIVTGAQRELCCEPSPSNTDGPKEAEDEERWLEDPSFQWADEVSEAEDEGMGLILSFLLRQIALFTIVHRLLPMRGDPLLLPPLQDKLILLSWSVGFLFLMAMSTAVSMHAKRTGLSAHLSRIEHLQSTVQATFAMAFTLCLCRLGEWMMRGMIKDVALCLVATAMATTIAVLVAIVLLDKLADMMIPESESWDAEEHKNKDNKGHVSKEMSGETHGVVNLVDTKSAALRFFDDLASSSHLKEFMLRRIIEGLGLAVGISWEKAFHSSEESVIEGFVVTRSHKVVSKLLFAILLVGVIFPAWLWYLVPKARMHWRDFQIAMETQKGLIEGLNDSGQAAKVSSA